MISDEAIKQRSEFDRLSKDIEAAREECSRTWDKWSRACATLRSLEAEMRPIWLKMRDGADE